ncbi:hypothetical protein Q8F55_001702 [Vanrija albida]|uniref:Amidase domain-containing protein n=1 Tax=Vanrija albida TaxID=181172 RepID=A0ABR3Q7P7_9TREE
MEVAEASIAELRAALDAGEVTAVGLVEAYLRRIGAYDHHGPRLNSVPVLSPTVFAEARASDLRRAAGHPLSPLDGIPYTAKDSYKASGLPVSGGSPAFEHLIASADSFVISRLRAAGAILLGLTTMPPLANGGMQRGLHGRAESPYNGAYLTSAWASGSSNGSGTATAASFGAFGLGEETWSSGRAPASCNALYAYTPSWGTISIRGNWPLVPTMDVVVPHTRGMGDMLAVLDAIVADDSDTRGNFWRTQDWVSIPPASELRPKSYPSLLAQAASPLPLQGKRIAFPRCFLGEDDHIPTRASVVALARAAAARLESLGAEVVYTDLPVRDAYEVRDGSRGKDWFQGGLAPGYVPEAFWQHELVDLAAFALDDFLSANGGTPASFAQADAAKVFPLPLGQIKGDYGDDMEMGHYVGIVAKGTSPPEAIPTIAEGVRGLNRAREELLEAWLDESHIDALAFPTLADVAPADADHNPQSHGIATRDGTWVANGNLWVRHLGVPTVTVPMGADGDTRMPFGLTFAGRAWDDAALLSLGAAYGDGVERPLPARAPPLGAPLRAVAEVGGEGEVGDGELALSVQTSYGDSTVQYAITATAPAPIASATATLNGRDVPISLDGATLTARGVVPADELNILHSQYTRPYGSIVVVTVRCAGAELGAYTIVNGR